VGEHGQSNESRLWLFGDDFNKRMSCVIERVGGCVNDGANNAEENFQGTF
jgi:hypothetical protein